ncbi:MAG: glycosyltransferase family 2 protein [Candidatus Omnitrophota bacterium]
MKLSVIIPVCNEEKTLAELIEKVVSIDIDKELIIVDDGSKDKTKEILAGIRLDAVRIISHDHKRGKGAAIKSALKYASGDTVIIQDADLEYDPEDYYRLIEPIKSKAVDIVYGSRFLYSKRVTTRFHYLVNQFLTFITNLLFRSSLTDMETCYKVFTSEIIKDISLESEGFEIEAELTAKALQRRHRILEVPISYRSRSYHEGKKISWIDGVKSILVLIKIRFFRFDR